MTREEIVAKVRGLNLPVGSSVVFGSCPLAAAGIREANDIDLLVSKAVFVQLKKLGWREVDKGASDRPLVQGVFEAHNNWNFSSYKPPLKQLLATATVVDGVPFASLQEVRKWKAASGRPKDLVDIKLIDEHLQKSEAG